MLEAHQLSVSIGKRRILHQVSLTLGKGEIVGLIGANGSGKSTLLRALMGLLPAEEGQITLAGKPLGEYPPREVAHAIAYLPQNPECHWPLTADRVVALGRLPFHGCSTELDAAHIERALAAVDALHLRERPIHELSGGERSRVFLARALAGNPALMLIDEPGAGLDPYHQLQLLELLQKLSKAGNGVLLVLHDLGLAARFCDRLCLLQQGRLIAAGSPENVLTDALLEQAHGIIAYRNWHQGMPALIPWERIPGRANDLTP